MSETTKRLPQTVCRSCEQLLRLERKVRDLRKDQRSKIKDLQIKARGVRVLGKVLQDSLESNVRLKEEVEQLKHHLNQHGVDPADADLLVSTSADDENCKYGIAEQGCSYHSSIVKSSTEMQDYADARTASGPQSISTGCNLQTLFTGECYNQQIGEEKIHKVSKTERKPYTSLPELQDKNVRKKMELQYIGVTTPSLQKKEQNNSCALERKWCQKDLLAATNNKMMQLNLAGDPFICQGDIVRSEAQAPYKRQTSVARTCAAQVQQQQQQALRLTGRELEASANGPDEHLDHVPAPPKEKATPTPQQHKVKRHVKMSKRREEENQGLKDDLQRVYEEKEAKLKMELKLLSNKLEGYELGRQERVIYRCEQLKQELINLSQDIDRMQSQAQAEQQAQVSLMHQKSDSARASQVPRQKALRPGENGLGACADEPEEDFNHVPSPPKEKATRSSQKNEVKRKRLSGSKQPVPAASFSSPEVFIVENTPYGFRTSSPQLYVSFPSLSSAFVYVQSFPEISEPETR